MNKKACDTICLVVYAEECRETWLADIKSDKDDLLIQKCEADSKAGRCESLSLT